MFCAASGYQCLMGVRGGVICQQQGVTRPALDLVNGRIDGNKLIGCAGLPNSAVVGVCRRCDFDDYWVPLRAAPPPGRCGSLEQRSLN